MLRLAAIFSARGRSCWPSCRADWAGFHGPLAVLSWSWGRVAAGQPGARAWSRPRGAVTWLVHGQLALRRSRSRRPPRTMRPLGHPGTGPGQAVSVIGRGPGAGAILRIASVMVNPAEYARLGQGGTVPADPQAPRQAQSPGPHRPHDLSPKLRPVRRVISCLTWCFAGLAGWRSAYVKVSGIGVLSRLKASRCVPVGSVSMGTVTWVPAKRTWLRVSVARCSSRPRTLR